MALTDGIHFVLVPEPKMGKTAYLATATCTHGESQHVVFGRAEVVAQTIAENPLMRGFRDPHRWAVDGCACEIVEVVMKPEAED
jgi:hypothetical protein